MEEIEIEIVLAEAPDVPRAVEGLAKHLGLEPRSLGMTSTHDRLADTSDLALLSQDHSLRVRQKLENVYAGTEVRLTYKYPLEEHDRLLIRSEEKLKLLQPDYDSVLSVLGSLTQGVAGQQLTTQLCIDELAREANLGEQGARVNISVDECTYYLPDNPDKQMHEVVFEIESHGVPHDVILTASDWVLKNIGGREAKQCKYARGMRLLGVL